MIEKGCDNCYYEYFDSRAYPCSLCIRGIKRTDMWQPSKKTKADRKTEPSDSEKTNNCEPKICDTCRYYNSNIPCGSTPSACKEADKFAKEFVDGLKKLEPKDEPQKMGSIERPKTGICAKCGRADCEQKMEHIDNCNGYIEPQTEVIACPIIEDDADYYERLYADDIKRMKEERSNNE